MHENKEKNISGELSSHVYRKDMELKKKPRIHSIKLCYFVRDSTLITLSLAFIAEAMLMNKLE